jgi:mycothiol synthase
MLNLLPEARPLDWLTDYPSRIDLQETFASGGMLPPNELWWESGSRLAAYAYILTPYNNLSFDLRQDVWQESLEDEIIAWGVEQAQLLTEKGIEIDEHVAILCLDVSCRAEDTRRASALVRNGFVLQPEQTLRMSADLSGSLPAVELPAGFVIRPLRAERELEAVVSLHRAAFGTQWMTVEERRAIMHSPEYDPALDLLVEAPDGRIAAYCIVEISTITNELTGRCEGSIDPLAVHPDFQRRGLARALLQTGMDQLARRGILRACLGTSSSNLAMQQAAKSAGFQVTSTHQWYSLHPDSGSQGQVSGSGV